MAITFVRALATYVFIIPNSFAPGGVSGISSIVYNIAAVYNQRLADTVFNPGVVVFILNIPLMIWAFKVLDKRFAFSSMVSVALFAVFMMTLTWIKFPQFIATNYESGIMLLAALAGRRHKRIGPGHNAQNEYQYGRNGYFGKNYIQKELCHKCSVAGFLLRLRSGFNVGNIRLLQC